LLAEELEVTSKFSCLAILVTEAKSCPLPVTISVVSLVTIESDGNALYNI
jgi:hypothetical protein